MRRHQYLPELFPLHRAGPRIYSFDILGAGLGCLGIIVALFALHPVDALRLVGTAGMVAAALACVECRWHRPWLPALLLLSAIVPAGVPGDWIALRPSEYKELSQALRIGNARVVAQRSSPLGLVTVVESPSIPLRHAPGLSLNASQEPPAQLAVFTDGDGLSALNRYDGRREPLAYLGDLTSALPYHLLRDPKVLVLGSGAGADVLQAVYHQASAVDAVELNPQVIDLVQGRFAAFSGKPYSAAASVSLPARRADSWRPARHATTSSRWPCWIHSARHRPDCTRSPRAISRIRRGSRPAWQGPPPPPRRRR